MKEKNSPNEKWTAVKTGTEYKIQIGTEPDAPSVFDETQYNDAQINANLAAAAPELLEALLSVDRYFKISQNRIKITDQSERLWGKVARAINKATI